MVCWLPVAGSTIEAIENPIWAASNDQERIMTPKEAMERGASYLVVGRPITTHPNPKEAARMVVAEMAEAVLE